LLQQGSKYPTINQRNLALVHKNQILLLVIKSRSALKQTRNALVQNFRFSLLDSDRGFGGRFKIRSV
jgi:hypothetical protein